MVEVDIVNDGDFVFECDNQGCGKRDKRREVEDHETKCEHREVKCPKCRKKVALSSMKDHLYNKDKVPQT